MISICDNRRKSEHDLSGRTLSSHYMEKICFVESIESDQGFRGYKFYDWALIIQHLQWRFFLLVMFFTYGMGLVETIENFDIISSKKNQQGVICYQKRYILETLLLITLFQCSCNIFISFRNILVSSAKQAVTHFRKEVSN